MPSRLPPLDARIYHSIGSNIAKYHEQLGKPSILFNYCNQAIRRGFSEFVLVCVDDANGTIALDVNPADTRSLLDMHDIRSWYYAHRGYWRRIFPRKLELVPVDITIKAIDRFNRIRVTADEVNYATKYAEIERGIQVLTSEIREMGHNLSECFVEHDGAFWHGIGCGVEDNHRDCLCPVERRLLLRRELELLKREEWQLKNSWQSSLGQGTRELLEDTGLIHRYRDYRSLKRIEIYSPPSLRGFKLRIRWNYPKLGWTVVIALLFSLCVGGVSTGASKNFQTGLAAAGLVATLEGLIVSFLTIYDKFTAV